MGAIEQFESFAGLSGQAVITSILLVLVGLAIGQLLPRTERPTEKDAFREELEQKLGSP